MKYQKFKIPDEVALPDNPELFSRLLLNYGFIRKAFRLGDSVQAHMAESIKEYLH